MRKHPLQDGVERILSDEKWHTLQEMAEMLGTSSQSVGCQISRLKGTVAIECEWAVACGRYFELYRINKEN